jgi:hypothetical protein
MTRPQKIHSTSRLPLCKKILTKKLSPIVAAYVLFLEKSKTLTSARNVVKVAWYFSVAKSVDGSVSDSDSAITFL